MTVEKAKLKLGKGVAFVKSRLLRLPQTADTWEVDIQPMAGKQGRIEFWLGMVLEQEHEHGGMPANQSFDHSPTVNDLAKLLADAMYRPLSEDGQHRPATILLRQNPAWDELVPHLRQLGIEVAFADALPTWTEAVHEQRGVGWARFLRNLGAPTDG